MTLHDSIQWLESLEPSEGREATLQTLRTLVKQHDRMNTTKAGDFYYVAMSKDNYKRWVYSLD